jgi:hypothetical protein
MAPATACLLVGTRGYVFERDMLESQGPASVSDKRVSFY